MSRSPPDRLFVTGASGSGKTTFLDALTTALRDPGGPVHAMCTGAVRLDHRAGQGGFQAVRTFRQDSSFVPVTAWA
ncbi:ATP-binding protein [Streptomyces paradoxus]|uniref:ATP-binding protein n=1 Tax=Streptomyces paradoxus TaxID=66375 RepID=UPI0036FBDE6B